MKSLPILMNKDMVLATLSGQKTNTRRIITPQPLWKKGLGLSSDGWCWELNHTKLSSFPHKDSFTKAMAKYSPYGNAGDLLWVRENWAAHKKYDDVKPRDIPKSADIHYMADGEKPEWAGRTRPNIFLCKWMSRITLFIEEIRVERLQDITSVDCESEGIKHVQDEWPAGDLPAFQAYGQHACFRGYGAARLSFMTLWETINGKDSWAANPWVWVIKFDSTKIKSIN